MSHVKKPFCCRLDRATIALIKRKAREIRGSQADAITHWAHGIGAPSQPQPVIIEAPTLAKAEQVSKATVAPLLRAVQLSRESENATRANKAAPLFTRAEVDKVIKEVKALTSLTPAQAIEQAWQRSKEGKR